jgi:hypothetical protein
MWQLNIWQWQGGPTGIDEYLETKYVCMGGV